jgi:hypothetical protein
MKIKLPQSVKGYVDNSVFVTPPFLWKPVPFVVEHPRLVDRIISAEKQNQSLEKFTANPKLPMTYFITGALDDRKAKYFAAYLCSHHLKTVNSSIHWESITGGFDNPLLKAQPDLTMLVISNIPDFSSGAKLEKVRDIVSAYPNIPKVLIGAGEDPVSLSYRLKLPAHGLAYFGSNLTKNYQEVI